MVLLLSSMLRDVPLQPDDDLRPPYTLTWEDAEATSSAQAWVRVDAMLIEPSTDLDLLREFLAGANVPPLLDPGQKPPTLADVDAAIAENAPAWQAFTGVADGTPVEFAWPADPFNARFPFLTMVRMFRLLSVRIGAHLQRGDVTQAVVELELGLRALDGIEAGARSCIGALIYIGLHEKCVESAQLLLAQPLGDAEHESLARTLAVDRGTSRYPLRALYGEYYEQSRLVRLLETESAPVIGGDYDGLPRSLFYKSNRTRNRVANLTRKWKAVLEAPHSEFVALAASYEGEFDVAWTDRVGDVIQGNLVGEMLISIANSPDVYVSIRSKELATIARGRQLRVAHALIRHEQKHGELPTTLDELVPAYLDAVPLDPFDEQPMRFDRKGRAVYSIGLDLTDSGGSIGDSAEPEEPTVIVPVPK